MIDSITAKRFKRFRDTTVNLHGTPVAFLAGANNTGKSTLLHGLAVWEFCRTVIEAEKGREAFLPGSKAQGVGVSSGEFLPINVPALNHLWTNLQSQKAEGDDSGFTLRLRCDWREGADSRHLEFGLALANERVFLRTTSSEIQRDSPIPRVAYLPPFAGITDRESRVPGAIRRRRIGEGLAGAVLRNLLLDLAQRNSVRRAELKGGRDKIKNSDLADLRRTDPWELLQQILREVFAAELQIALFREEYHSYIRVDVVKGTVSGHKVTKFQQYRPRDLMVEGSGFLQWLSVIALAVDPSIGVLALDEPDAHLHPSLQTALVERLTQIATQRGTRVLVATHSSEILRAAATDQILEVRESSRPRFLSSARQKVALLAGIGSDFAPRIDAVRRLKRVLFVEGSSDRQILEALAARLGRTLDPGVFVWEIAFSHRDRKHLFLALRADIPELEVISLRDRDDQARGTVGADLQDGAYTGLPAGFSALVWQRRHIESYLLCPAAIAAATGLPEATVVDRLRDDHGLAIGATFPDAAAPRALLDASGKDILRSLGANPLRVAEDLEPDRVPEDIVTLLDAVRDLA